MVNRQWQQKRKINVEKINKELRGLVEQQSDP